MNHETLALDIEGQAFDLLIPDDSPNALHFRDLYRRNGQYEAVMCALVARLLATQERPVFADIGAFLGYYSAYAARLLGDRGESIAVESNPAYVGLIEAMLEHNRIDNTRVFHAALSDREETLWAQGTTLHDGSEREDAVLRTAPEHAPVERLPIPGREGAAVAVQTVTFDRLCAEQCITPTMAKIDVHGTEGKVLGGMGETLRGPLEFVLLELHKNIYLRKYAPGISRMRILDLLDEAGFGCYYVAGHRYTWSDGLARFHETGGFAYQPLTRETRGLLLFDRHADLFVVASKRPLEEVVGPSVIDPGLE